MAIEIEAVNPDGRDQSDFLGQARSEAREWQGRYATLPAEEYFKGLHSGKINNPFPNAASIGYAAITEKGFVEMPSGRRRYRLFTDREDDLAILGKYREIGEFVEIIATAAQTGSKDRMIVLVGPSGSGKTTIIESFKNGISEYTRRNPVYVIDECPINDSPNLLLWYFTPETQREIREACRIPEMRGEPCPHCQNRIEKDLTIKGDPLRVPIRRVSFSTGLGRGIGKIDPKDTQDFYDENVEKVMQAILNSGGGILHIAEYGKQGDEIYDTLNDFIRGRRIQRGGLEYVIDTLVIADMTLDEYEKLLKDPDSKPLQERMSVVVSGYSLSVSEEASIYKKFFSEANGKNIHVPGETFEALAIYAVRSRTTPVGLKGVTISPLQKMRLYDGEDIEGISPSMRKEIEEEGRRNKEGLLGVTPAEIKDLIMQLVTKSEGCIDPTTALIQVKNNIESLSMRIRGYREIHTGYFAEVWQDWHERAKAKVEQAFRAKYEEACNNLFDEYIKNLDAWFGGTGYIDQVTGQVRGIDMPVLDTVELAIFQADGSTDVSSKGLEARRQQFRSEVFRRVGSAARHSGECFTLRSIPELQKGIQKIVSGDKHTIEELLQAVALNTITPEQQMRIKEAEQVLIERHGFCSRCAPRLIQQAAFSSRRR